MPCHAMQSSSRWSGMLPTAWPLCENSMPLCSPKHTPMLTQAYPLCSPKHALTRIMLGKHAHLRKQRVTNRQKHRKIHNKQRPYAKTAHPYAKIACPYAKTACLQQHASNSIPICENSIPICENRMPGLPLMAGKQIIIIIIC